MTQSFARLGVRTWIGVLGLSALLLALPGCKTEPKVAPAEAPDYTRPLPSGDSALRKITDPSQLPDPGAAYAGKDASLMTALDRSIGWFKVKSTNSFFPKESITHDQAAASVYAMKSLLTTCTGVDDFRQRFYQEFDAYISVGWNNKGTVLYTAYFTPIFKASAVRTDEFKYPLYKRPADLVRDPITGAVQGRRVGSTVMPGYPSRAQIESSNILAGQELVWLNDPFDVFVIQVNGSGKLMMTDGSVHYVGFSADNGHPYTSVAKQLVADGKLSKNQLNLTGVRNYFKKHPEDLASYVGKNERYVFFQDYAGDAWPSGSIGVKVTDYRSLATDKEIFPRAGVVLTQTTVPTFDGGTKRFDQFMLDQDTGGAIRAPGRADIYMGVGPDAEAIAGRQLAEGWLFYFFIKPERLPYWQSMMNGPQQPK